KAGIKIKAEMIQIFFAVLLLRKNLNIFTSLVNLIYYIPKKGVLQININRYCTCCIFFKVV
ncbi:MAG: hypothetical protein PHU59_02720, partial [Candidatus Omnitrophica bacterium]|nr:hypothetical protein [Candidatus Omnitrophota bacterium]